MACTDCGDDDQSGGEDKGERFPDVHGGLLCVVLWVRACGARGKR